MAARSGRAIATTRPVKLGVVYGFAAWLLLMPGSAHADTTTQMLIHVSGLDSVAALAMGRSRFPRAAATDPDLLKIIACVDPTKDAGIAEILADAAETTMSFAELQEAQRFFDSPAGIKYRDLRIWQALAEFDLPEDLPVPLFSKQEEVHITAFLETPAGVKLSVPQLISVPQVANRLFDQTVKLVGQCFARPEN